MHAEQMQCLWNSSEFCAVGAHLVEELLGVRELVLPGVHLGAVEPELEVDGQRALSRGGGLAHGRLEERDLLRDLLHSPVEGAFPVPLGPSRGSSASGNRPRAAKAEGEERGGV